MRIFHLTRDFPPRSTGGTSIAVGNLIAALTRSDTLNAVASFDHWRSRSASRGGHDVVTTGRKNGVVMRVRHGSPFAEVARVAADFAPTLLHLHHENLWPFAAYLRRSLGVPIAYTCHTVQPPTAPTITTRDQTEALASADALITPSRWAAEHLARLASRRSKEIHIVPNVVPCPSRPPPKTRAGRRVLYVGRFDQRKGTDLLFDAMRKVLSIDTKATFDIAGGLPASGKRERRWMRRWSANCEPQHASRVTFHGWMEPDALDELYSNCTAQIVPSRFETFGLSAAEGMARALPVIATDIPALAELIEDGDTGYLSALTSDALAQKVVDVLDDRHNASRCGTRAMSSIAMRFAPKVLLPAIVSLYEYLHQQYAH